MVDRGTHAELMDRVPSYARLITAYDRDDDADDDAGDEDRPLATDLRGDDLAMTHEAVG